MFKDISVDKLRLRFNDLDIEMLIKVYFMDIITPEYKPGGKFYEHCIVVRDPSGTHQFTIYYGPKYPNISKYTIELNPAKQQFTLPIIKTWLWQCTDVDRAVIGRIDLKVDDDFDTDEITRSIIFKGRKSKTTPVGETLYCGTKYNKWKVYDRQGGCCEDGLVVGNDSRSRIELSLSNHCASKEFSSLAELERKLADYDPMKSIMVLIPTNEHHYKLKAKRFEHRSTMHDWYRNHNRKSNFKRDWIDSGIFTLSDKPEIWAAKLRAGSLSFLDMEDSSSSMPVNDSC
jgi:hypothetical protein